MYSPACDQCVPSLRIEEVGFDFGGAVLRLGGYLCVTDLAGVDLLDRMMKILNCIKKQVYRSLLIYIRANTYSIERI